MSGLDDKNTSADPFHQVASGLKLLRVSAYFSALCLLLSPSLVYGGSRYTALAEGIAIVWVLAFGMSGLLSVFGKIFCLWSPEARLPVALSLLSFFTALYCLATSPASMIFPMLATPLLFLLFLQRLATRFECGTAGKKLLDMLPLGALGVMLATATTVILTFTDYKDTLILGEVLGGVFLAVMIGVGLGVLVKYVGALELLRQELVTKRGAEPEEPATL